MTKILFALVASVGTIVLMLWLLSSGDRPVRWAGGNGAEKQSLVLFCAASNRAVMEAVKQDYQQEFGVEIQIQYGASQTLLSSIEVSQVGDLFLPADDSYLEVATQNQLVAEILPIARMQAVVAIPRGNPLNITRFEDLLRNDVRLVQASPDAAAVGKVVRDVLQESELWAQLDAATEAYRTTVTDVANDILVGAADAGIVYDAVLHTYPKLEYLELSELSQANSQISVGVIASTKQPQAALHFARYISARDRGLNHYAEHGFRVSNGDQWNDVPELSVFAGSMLRPAIEKTITAFEQREGVRVSRVYNGCGILVGQMKAGQTPDAYFACDTEFMNQVTDLFPESVPVSQNELVILVQKGNPHGVASLRDLTRPGLRVGIGHEKQCAMGWLTQNTFREGGLQSEIMPNVTMESPTGDMLVNALRTGALDAAVAYLSNAAGSADVLDAIQIHGIACSVATQPWAVAAQSKYPQLASRLFAKITSVDSQQVFAKEGFRWQLGQDGQPAVSQNATATAAQ